MKFTKADLKPYMRAITRNGDFHIYLEDKEVFIDERYNYIPLNHYTRSLENLNNKKFDIVEVCEIEDHFSALIDFLADSVTVWEREESIEDDDPFSDKYELLEDDEFPLEGKIATIDGFEYRLTAVKDND